MDSFVGANISSAIERVSINLNEVLNELKKQPTLRDRIAIMYLSNSDCSDNSIREAYEFADKVIKIRSE